MARLLTPKETHGLTAQCRRLRLDSPTQSYRQRPGSMFGPLVRKHTLCALSYNNIIIEREREKYVSLSCGQDVRVREWKIHAF